MGRATVSSPSPLRGGAIFFVFFVGASSAQATERTVEAVTDDLKRACVAQHEAAQLLRRAGKLTEARATMLACSQDSCPSVVSADCASWLDAVVAAIPTVVVSAKTGGRGEDTVSVTVDGKLVATRLDGRPIEVDPGLHTFRFEASAQDAIEQTVTLAEGEKDRPLNISFARPEPYVTSDVLPDTYRPTPAVAYVLGSVAAAGLGVFAGFGFWGVNERMSLQSSCSPSCSQSQLSSVRTKLVAADAGLGVAILSLAGATYAYVRRPTVQRKIVARRACWLASNGAPTFAVAPTASGVLLSVRGRF